MSSVAAQTYLTPKEYLAFERKATTKHEYLNGQIVARSGANFAHNFTYGEYSRIISNIQLIGGRVSGRCTSDMRVKVTEIRDSYFYPDVVVVCGEPRS